MPRTVGRVIIPKNVESLLELAKSICEKHKADGAGSILKNLDGMSWDEIEPVIEKCLEKHREAEEYKRKMEQAYRERDLHLPDIEMLIRSSAGMLKGAFSKNPKKLGDWGFAIDDSVQNKKKKTASSDSTN